MKLDSPRIVSLLPSATEIVVALGLQKHLVGRSYACNWPSEISELPVCAQPRCMIDGNSKLIHDQVMQTLVDALSVFELDFEMIRAVKPTHIITQDQCEVCAVSLSDVKSAFSQIGLDGAIEIITLNPTRLGEVWASIRQVGKALGVDPDYLCVSLTERILRISTKESDTPIVATIEWLNPLMRAGNWVPELVGIAGGKNLFGLAGQHSSQLKFKDLLSADPDIIIFMPCGFNLNKTLSEVKDLLKKMQWNKLRAIHNGQVYAVDGDFYFNRPGPRLVESTEILAEIFHPNLYHFNHENVGWRQIQTKSISETNI